MGVLPFLRQMEFRQQWYPRMVGLFFLSLLFLALYRGLQNSMFLPDWGVYIFAVLCFISLLGTFFIHLRFPAGKDEKKLFHTLRERGIWIKDHEMVINLYAYENVVVPWQDIGSFYRSRLESADNIEVLIFKTTRETYSLPFINLTEATRIPIPGMLEDEEKLYYCYEKGKRIPATAENNDFYRAIQEKLPDKEKPHMIERMFYQCPSCNERFPLRIREWKKSRKDVLYCDQCPKCVSLNQSSPDYEEVYSLYSDSGESTVIKRDGKEVTLRGFMGVEPREYTFEIRQGDPQHFDYKEKRGPRFREKIETKLERCSCGGTYTYKALPRCPLCSQPVPEMVMGLGYGRYAVITEELTWP